MNVLQQVANKFKDKEDNKGICNDTMQNQYYHEAQNETWKEYINNSTVILITTYQEWTNCISKIGKSKLVGIDTETTGLDPHQNSIRLIQLSIPTYIPNSKKIINDDYMQPRKGSTSMVFVLDMFSFNQAEKKKIVEDIINIISSKETITIFHNAVFDLKMLRAEYGKRFKAKVFDTMIASQLVTAGYFIPEDYIDSWCAESGIECKKTGNEVRFFDEHGGNEIFLQKDNQKYYKPYYYRHRLSDVVYRHLGIVLEKTEQQSNWGGEVTNDMLKYAARDVIVLIPIFEILCKLLSKNELIEVAAIEFNCIPATAEIEFVGMPFDSIKAKKIKNRTASELDIVQSEIIQLAKELEFKPKKRKGRKGPDDEIQVQSNMEIVEFIRYQCENEKILSEDRESIVIGGEYIRLSTQNDILISIERRLSDESQLKKFINYLREFRRIKKRVDFLDKYTKSINPETDRIHTSLRQLNPQGVGRFSASEPNLQQVGNDTDIRELFHVADGIKFVDADYSAVEMRIMTQVTEDDKLIEAFTNNIDIHKYTAANISGIKIEDVSKTQRQSAKAVNFGLIYGMSHETLKKYAETSYGVFMTEEEAANIRNNFFEVYTDIRSWQDSQCNKRYLENFEVYFGHDYKNGLWNIEQPSVRTLSGRMRVWEVEEKVSRWGNPYMCKVGSVTELYNTPVQGTGADIIKKAMSLVYNGLIERGWDDVNMIMTVHDELLLECPANKAEEVKSFIISIMREAAKKYITLIPMEVEGKIMDSWAEK